MKTGYTGLARHNLVTTAERDGRILIGVTLHEPSWGVSYTQMTAQLNGGFNGGIAPTAPNITYAQAGAASAAAFAEDPADLVVVEVGLGGRFDGTNVFDAPAVSVITPVDYDHLEMLGPELSKIAWEKAGIIKAGDGRWWSRASSTGRSK